MSAGDSHAPGRIGNGRRPRLRLFRLDAPAYKRVFAEKRSVYGRSLVMWIAQGADADRRVGVIVSKRNFRRAVDRARAKRLLREAFRLSRPFLAPDADLILIARTGIGGQTCREVMADFERVCRRARIWRRDADPENKTHA
ncbi:MAG TPA: ribonuclease P protein component [Kiritimatiellia bacterium]|nr:ribonuclease P protein component [Kiritimatiellia bacterium]